MEIKKSVLSESNQFFDETNSNCIMLNAIWIFNEQKKQKWKRIYEQLKFGNEHVLQEQLVKTFWCDSIFYLIRSPNIQKRCKNQKGRGNQRKINERLEETKRECIREETEEFIYVFEMEHKVEQSNAK